MLLFLKDEFEYEILVVELIHSGLNLKFDMSVVFMSNYSFSDRRLYW
jgi:hypothetical protein